MVILKQRYQTDILIGGFVSIDLANLLETNTTLAVLDLTSKS